MRLDDIEVALSEAGVVVDNAAMTSFAAKTIPGGTDEGRVLLLEIPFRCKAGGVEDLGGRRDKSDRSTKGLPISTVTRLGATFAL